MAEEKIIFIIGARDNFSKVLKKQSAAVQSIDRRFSNLRSTILGLGGLAFARGLINQIGMLEEGWISMAKTTGLVGEELEALKQEIRDLSVEMEGISIEEFQDIARIAGQLGIKGVTNISKFTKVVAKMGVATNLTAAQAAEDFAQMSNILNEPIENLELMGSVMNELSNNTVATSSDISNLTKRMGGAAETLGLTTSEVLGISATLRDMGVSIEVGGTAMSQVFQKMLTDTEEFAQVAGLEVNEFAQKVLDNPIEALKILLKQMGTLGKFGAARALEDLGLEGVRVGGVLLKMSGGMEKLNDNLEMANKEWETGTSLQKEYEVASESLFAQTTSVSNAFKILAEDMGQTLLPAIKEVLPFVKDLIDGFSAMGKGIGIAIAKLTGATDPLKDDLEDARKRMEQLGRAVKDNTTGFNAWNATTKEGMFLIKKYNDAKFKYNTLLRLETQDLESARVVQVDKNKAIEEEIRLKKEQAAIKASQDVLPEEFEEQNQDLQIELDNRLAMFEGFFGMRLDQENIFTGKLAANAQIHSMAERARANIVGVAYQTMENAALKLLETGKLSLGAMGQVIAQQVKIELLGIAVRSGVQAVYQYALGLGSAAMFGPGPPSSIHFASAATFAKTSALAGGGAVAIQGIFGGGASRAPAGEVGGEPIRTTPVGAGIVSPAGIEERPTQNIVVNINNPLSDGNWEAIGMDLVNSINTAGKDANVELTIRVKEE